MCISVGSLLHNGSTPGMSELGLCFTFLRGSQKLCAAHVLELLPLVGLQHVLPEVWLQIRHAAATQRFRMTASSRSQPWAWTWISRLERLTLLSSLLNLVCSLPACMLSRRSVHLLVIIIYFSLCSGGISVQWEILHVVPEADPQGNGARGSE